MPRAEKLVGEQQPPQENRIRGRNGGSRQIHQPISNGVDDEFGGFVNAQTIHDVGAMHGNGVRAEIEFRGDFLVGFSSDDMLQDFEFARGETGFTFTFEGFRALDLRIENGLACGDAFDGLGQIEIVGVLENVAAGAGLRDWRTRVSSECMLSMRTAVSGCACRILRVASRPFISGN